MSGQLIRNIIIVILAVFTIFILTYNNDTKIEQEQFEGEIYNRSSSKLLEKKKSPNLQHNEKKDNNPETELPEPVPQQPEKKEQLENEHIKKISETKNIVSNKKKPSHKKKVGTPAKTKEKDNIIEKKISAISNKNEISISSATTTIKYDYSILNDIIKNNNKTFFYFDNSNENSDVSVGVYSITPHQNYHILKFQVKNDSASYFFIGNIEIRKKSKIVICEKFYDTIVPKDKTLEGIILAPKFNQGDKIKFKLYESGNKDRKYEISIKIP